MSSMLAAFLRLHTASVETFTGATPTGDGYAATVEVQGFLDDGTLLSRDPGGEQIVAKSVFYTDLANVAVFAPESRVTCNGRQMQVTQVHRRDGGSILAPVSHLEVWLA